MEGFFLGLYMDHTTCIEDIDNRLSVMQRSISRPVPTAAGEAGNVEQKLGHQICTNMMATAEAPLPIPTTRVCGTCGE